MNNADKAQIIARYQTRLQAHGPSEQALATGNAERRQIRFDVLSSVGDLQGASILDIGCGLADFYVHLKSCGIKVDYTGYDITPEFVEIAGRRHPEARFEVRDVQTAGIEGEYDYVVSSQTFNNRLLNEDNRAVIKEVIRLGYASCRRGLAIDMMTSHVDFQEERLFYYSPEEMFTYAKTVTKRVQLRHDYPLYEFTLYLYRDFTGWKK